MEGGLVRRYGFVLLVWVAMVIGLKPFGIEFTWMESCWDQRYTRHAFIPEGC
jgi:hypothetical protein